MKAAEIDKVFTELDKDTRAEIEASNRLNSPTS